jgi:hypothetical protein
MTLLPYMVAMSIVGSVPPHVSAVTWAAAHRHGQDPVVLGAYLVSEHGDDWTPDPEACSSRGACGPFQLAALWADHFGYPREARANLWAAANMAAMLLEHSQARHERCGEGHDFRAHLKASPGGRDSIGWIVRGWKRYEVAIRAAMAAEGDA